MTPAMATCENLCV